MIDINGLLHSARAAILSIPKDHRTDSMGMTLMEIDRKLPTVEGKSFQIDRPARIIIINTLTGSSKEISSGFKPAMLAKLRRLEMEHHLSEEPAGVKIILQHRTPDHTWEDRKALFTNDWNVLEE